jgi:hypothetical protein
VTHYLYLINVNGSGLRQLPVPPRCVTKTRYGATTKLERPDWGPSGELLFVCDRTEGVESATVMLAPDPQQPAREICKSNDLVDARLQLSPDGTQVLAGLAEPEVFPATPSAGACDLEPVFPDGVPGTDQEGEAVWSPDGRWVAWPLQPYGGPHSEQLWLGRADDGSGARAILTVHCSQNTSQCVHGLTSLAWLPQ